MMSDQASTQKAFNRVVKDKLEEESAMNGESDPNHGPSPSFNILEAYCGMHVGVNLRAAEVKGLNRHIKETGSPSVGVDLVVHSACKLLGHLGTNPEYGKGVVGFPEFLQAALENAQIGANAEDIDAIRAAINVRLERQVGSRYFVTSRNAGRLFFLAPQAVKYVQSLQIVKELNNLEKDVLRQLSNNFDRGLLKVDGIFFDKIYADLMCLLKSRKLNKKYLDMNLHFLELLEYLQHLTTHPRLSLDQIRRCLRQNPDSMGRTN